MSRPHAHRYHALVAAAAAFAPALTPAGAQQPTWTVTEERRVGPPAAEFGAVTDAALDGAGRLWIVDGMSGELHVAGEGGLRRVAVRGQGPGELTPGALELVVLPGDTIVVIEPQTWRLHRFGPDGRYVRTTSVRGEEGLTGGWRWLSGGRLVARIYPPTIGPPGAPPGAGGDPVRAFDREGSAGDVLAILPPTESFRMGAGPMPILTLLAPQPLWDVDERGRVLVASTHAYRVEAHEPGGSIGVVVTQRAEGGRVGRDVEAAARALLRETLAQRRTRPEVAERMVADASVAEAAPAIGGIMAGPGGTVWVQEAAATGSELIDLQRPGGPRWRIHDAQGRPAGTAVMPAGVQPLEWRGNRLVGIAYDDVGRTSAVVLRIDPPNGDRTPPSDVTVPAS